MALAVKGRGATPHQLDMGRLIVETTRGRGGDTESCAGAIATAIQESNLTNIKGGDRDSAGLYQQRPSMGWGSFAQVTTPAYAIGKFLDKFLVYRRKGQGWLLASHNTQRSAHPSAPARWYNEGLAFTREFAGSGGTGGSLSLSDPDGDGGMTGTQPYEFARGDANKKENTWEASGRLADEVQWRRFMRGGEFWYVSDDWLMKQSVVARLNEFSPGVVKLTFEHETRSAAADATLMIATRRYSILPGDVLEITDEGAGSGKWLVVSVRRTLHSQVSEVALQRKRPKLPEPAPQRAEVTVGGQEQATSGTATLGGDDLASRMYQAGEEATRMNWRYSDSGPGRNNLRTSADCLAAGTLIALERGLVPIEDVRLGDLALTRRGYRPVIDARLVREDAQRVAVALRNGRELVGTPDHRVWTENRGWVALAGVMEGDRFCTWEPSEPQKSSTTPAIHGDATPTPRHGTGPVYDLTIAGEHEFFADGVLVHNCSSGVSWVLRRAGIPTPPWAGNAPVSGAYIGWGQAGPGQRATIMTNAGHIWIRWNGIGAAWRFDTGGGSGGRNWPTPRGDVGRFVQRHWQGT